MTDFRDIRAAILDGAAHETVQKAIHSLLGNYEGTMTTREIAEALWPSALATGDDIMTRKRLFKILLAIADRSPYATHGAPRQQTSGVFKGKMVRPYLWAKPNEAIVQPVVDVTAGLVAWIRQDGLSDILTREQRAAVATAIEKRSST